MLKYLMTFLLLSLHQTSTNADIQSFTIKVNNIIPGKGQVVVALFSNKNVFLSIPTHFEKRSSNDKELFFTFHIPEGSYAISVFQDLNNNGELDKNWTGIPTEPIGFGNNYKPIGTPSFEKSKVNYTITENTASIKLYTIF